METVIDIEQIEQNEVDALPVKYNITDTAINQLRLQYAGLEIIDKPSYKAVVSAIADIRGRRTAVEKRRKELKAGALDYGRRVDGEAKRITELLEAIEEPLKERKVAEDSKETKRISSIQERIEAIRMMVPTVPTSPDALSEILFDVDTMEIGQNFEELREQAEAVRAEASARICQMIVDRLKWEAERKACQKELVRMEAIKAENARIEAERKSREEAEEKIRRAEREAIEIERRALEAEKAKLEIEKKQEQIKTEAEKNVVLEKAGFEHIANEEADKTAVELGDYAGGQGIKWDQSQGMLTVKVLSNGGISDKEKLISFLDWFNCVAYPHFTSQKAIDIFNGVRSMLDDIKKYIVEEVEKL